MPYIVAGTLTLPESSKPATNVTITFRNLMTVSPLIVASESSVTTSAIGAYSISLQYSVYAVEVTYYNNRPISAGQIVLNSETQTGLDLPTLLNGGEYEPATPEWILQIEAWLAQAQNSATASANSAQTSQSHADASAASAAASAASAAQASQITGLSTVADAIGLAMTPLPDVWAPLSDSLRMITGYGRDVLVGSDVVARMVNFSRSTTTTYVSKDSLVKTASVNEPRFEKDGLLVEGQSTNFIPWSEGAVYVAGNSGFQTITNGVSGVLPVVGQRISFATNNGETNANLAQTYLTLTGGQTYTYSTYFKVEAGDTSAPENCIGIYAANGLNIGARAVILKTGDGIYRVSIAFTVSGTGSQTVFVRFNRIGSPSAVWTAVVGGVQVENLPFASSYIPTNGAAVTRAVDRPTLPQSLNLGEIQLGFSLAVEFDTVNTGPHRILELSDFSTIIAEGSSLSIRHAGKEVYGINAPLGQRHHLAYSVAADGAITVALNGVLLAPQSRSAGAPSSTPSIVLGNRWSTTDRAIYGHLRDLKIWTKKPLTADQLKVASA